MTLRSHSALFLLLAIWASTQTASALCSETGRALETSNLSEELDTLVKHFAPTLVFHPDEKYFPCSPLFPLEGNYDDLLAAQSRLGTAESRKATYLALSLEEKGELAKVYYRVRNLKRDSGDYLIIDYWFYYVWNEYRVHGGLYPIWVDRSHPNDLEHIHLLLERKSTTETDFEDESIHNHFRLKAVYSSAHEGEIPANRFYPASEECGVEPDFLVELGAHATAPDANKDGLFTPGVDGRSGYKMLWGVRDRGMSWTLYRPSYTDPRSGEAVIVFSAASGTHHGSSFTYRLVSTDQLAEQFHQLALTDDKIRAIFETKEHWLKRVLGKSNGDSGKLILPPAPDTQSDAIGLNGFSSTERGIKLGGTTLADAPGILVGGRYGFLHGIQYLPDLIFELEGILTTRGKGFLSSQIYLSYPISAAVKVMGGTGLLTDRIDFRTRQWDWLAGLETRLGHVQIYTGFRSHGVVNDESIDIRLAYFF